MTKTKEQFINEANIIHGNKYDYSKVVYKNNHTQIEIICQKHGSFYTTPKIHLQGYNCGVCTGNAKLTTESFIQKAIEKHGIKYDYSKANYINSFSKITIICPEHGEFNTTARNHYYKGYGCKKCGYSEPHNRITQDEFIIRARNIHDNKYDYSKVEYKAWNKKIVIICPKHGNFKQNAGSHLLGCGCVRCGASNGEKLIRTILTNNKIEFIHQYKFLTCINPRTNRILRFDFYLPNYNLCIEYDGQQHFDPIKKWGGNKTLVQIQFRDQVKNEFCNNNNISLIRIGYKQNIEKILTNYFATAQTICNITNSNYKSKTHV